MNTQNSIAACLSSTLHLHPFGMQMPLRSYTRESYRFGFNGQENDEETNSQDYGWRWYNSGLARFWSVDPASPDFPMLSPYEFASNTPIWAMDIGGLQAWLTNDDASKIVSLEDWNNFVNAELKVVLDKQLKFDCADFALYLMARYHQARGLELTFVHPISGKTMSSNDPVYTDFNGFVYGLADGGKSFDGYYRGDRFAGLLGSFGAGNISLLAFQIKASQIKSGDFYSNTSHVSVAFPNQNYIPNDPQDAFTIYSGTGARGEYGGGGIDNFNFGRVPQLSTSFLTEYNLLYRFNFLLNLPRVSKAEIETKKAEPIPTENTYHKTDPFKKIPTVNIPSNKRNKKATKPNKANYSTKTPKNK